MYKDYTVSPYYDALLAKLTVRGRTWEETVSRMRRSLEEYVLRGVKTTIPFMSAIMQDPDFLASPFTGFGDTEPRNGARISWYTTAETLGETPLKMHYDGLDTFRHLISGAPIFVSRALVLAMRVAGLDRR